METRAALPDLMRNVVVAAKTLGTGQAALLVEANERLLMALLASTTAAESTVDARPAAPVSPDDLAAVNTAQQELSVLREQTEQAQAQLLQLRNAIAEAEHELANGHAARLIAVNEQLVYSALKAQIEAGERKAGSPKNPLPNIASPVVNVPDQEMARRQDVLCEANQQLVLAAITAQDRQSAAEAAQDQQTRFMAVLAHELRAPLTPIRLAAGMMQSMPQLQAVIERQVFHITRLVSDLVDVSRMNAGKMRLEQSLVDIKAAIRSAIGIFQSTINQRSQELLCSVPPHDVIIQGDAVRMEQIIINLLDNASKYTPDCGEIRLELVASDTSISIVVSDTGIGIEADALLHIFDPFIQHPRAVEFNATGLGIGLSVVRELVEAHGGSVVARSPGVGLGSQFTVTLPVVA